MDAKLPSPYILMKRSKRVLDFDVDGRPRHPLEAPKEEGRGELWKWGSNFSADAMIIHENKILLVRKPNGVWHLPGGFVKKTEEARECAIRKTCEKAFGGKNKEVKGILTDAPCKLVYSNMNNFDARTTAHSWIETSVFKWTLKDVTLPPLSAEGKWFSKDKLPKKTFGLHKILIMTA